MQKAGFFMPRIHKNDKKKNFVKVAATPESLLSKLKSQGLINSDSSDQEALNYLRYVGAYRLKGYCFQHLDPVTKKFPTGFLFNSITERYEFDRELRAVTASAIEILEVAIRTVMANHLSLSHSPHWFLNVNIFKPTTNWGAGKFISKIEQETVRSNKRIFISHYFNKYDDPYLPPSWAISECVTFGLWSRTYAILRDNHDKKAISMKFGIDQPKTFESWIHALTVIRNIVAHNGRVIGNKLDVAPVNSKNLNIKFNDNKSFYAVATVINVLLSKINIGAHSYWKRDLQSLFGKYPSISPTELGFYTNWDSANGW